MLTSYFFRFYRSVPTEDQILVPETLLKKRKSQEKQREERSAELAKKKKVGYTLPFLYPSIFKRNTGQGDDTIPTMRLDLAVDAVAYINHLSGLNRPPILQHKPHQPNQKQC